MKSRPRHPTIGRVLLTGASGELGQVLCRELARAGAQSIVAVSRDVDHLRTLEHGLSASHPELQFEAVAADLSTTDGLAKIEGYIRCPAASIDLLINNAGVISSGSLSHSPISEELAVAHVNVVATLRLCHAAVTTMVPRKTGTIVNVSSMIARTFSGRHPVYCGSRAFVSSFSESLRRDMQRYGVRVVLVEPGYIRSGMGKHARGRFAPFLLALSPERTAREIVKAVANDEPCCIPGNRHKVIALCLSILPRPFHRLIAANRDDD